MKKAITLLLAFVMLLSLAACGDSSTANAPAPTTPAPTTPALTPEPTPVPTPAEMIVGNWKLKEVINKNNKEEYDGFRFAYLHYIYEITFYKDGTFKLIDQYDGSLSGTYKLLHDGETIQFTIKDPGNDKIEEFPLILSNNELKLNGSNRLNTFVFSKQ